MDVEHCLLLTFLPVGLVFDFQKRAVRIWRLGDNTLSAVVNGNGNALSTGLATAAKGLLDGTLWKSFIGKVGSAMRVYREGNGQHS